LKGTFHGFGPVRIAIDPFDGAKPCLSKQNGGARHGPLGSEG
jgi:hypothetical protein